VSASIDHVVVWVDDSLRALTFYTEVVGLQPLRDNEFREGKAPFPSVRVSTDSIIDLTARSGAGSTDTFTGVTGSAGHPVNHLCLALDPAGFADLQRRLVAHDVPMSTVMDNLSGAKDLPSRSFYFGDPDGNVIEARCYP
jgi:glyoxylase I family protein